MRARRIAGCARCEHTQPINGRGICRTCDTQLRTGECEDSLDDYPITEDTVDWVVVDRALRWVLAHDRLPKPDKVDNMATRPTMTRAERAEVFEHAARHLPPWTAATYLGIGWKATKKHLEETGQEAEKRTATRIRPTNSRVVNCTACGRERPHKARGMCNPCYTMACRDRGIEAKETAA